jgi:hypothetical protein
MRHNETHGANLIRRTLTILLVLAALTPSHATAAWDRSVLPEPVRGMIHISASDVPPFPHVDSTLVDPHAWPPSVSYLGKRFDLTVLVSDEQTVRAVRSVADVPPHKAMNLSYVNREGISEWLAGPRYSWTARGRLETRVWYEPDSVFFRSSTYESYPSGMLRAYEVAARKQTPGPGDTLTVLTEYFVESGDLAGFSYDLYAGAQKQSQWWWDGAPVTAREWDADRRNRLK